MLTRLVAFDAPVRSPDGYGGVDEGFTGEGQQLKAAAHFRYLPGSEPVMAARLDGRQPIVITVHNSVEMGAVNSAWRMRDLHDGMFDTGGDWSGPIYNVRTDPVPSQDRLWLEILVETGVAV